MEDESVKPDSFESIVVEEEKLLRLKQILLSLVEKMTHQLTMLSNEIDSIVSVELFKQKMNDCKKIIEAAKVRLNHTFWFAIQPAFLFHLPICSISLNLYM
jgi:hypothetical protein